MHVNMKIQNKSRKLIKPYTPTPENLKNYKISLLDKHMPKMNFAVILFYQSKLKLEELEESLAQILVQFYPLAGRYMKNDLMIDCSDEGVELVAAEAVGDEIALMIAKADAEQLNLLLPDQYFRADEAPHDPLLSIQATRFPCGGLTIAISVSHRVMDAASLETFIAAWAYATNPDHKTTSTSTTITPSFDLHSLLPYRDHYFGEFPDQEAVANDVFVVKRLVFDKDALERLKSRFKISQHHVSRVRVVCAVISKALIGVYSAQHGGDFVIAQLVNMRERTALPQPKHACGNLVIPTATRRVPAAEAEAIGMEGLLHVIGDSVRKSIAEYAQILSPNTDGCQIIISILINLILLVCKPHTNVIMFTDWSKCGGFYEADFGFGKPVWVSIGPQRPDDNGNTTVLMSDREGQGIEAWVHLRSNDMHHFLQDDEIKPFLTS